MSPIPWILLAPAILLITLFAGIAIGRWLLVLKNRGEALVINTITAGFTRPYHLINNVTLKTGDVGTTQIDHVLVADTGIFVIETKHYQGWIFGGENQHQWTQVIYQKKSRFQNPIHQNHAHLKALQTLFTVPENSFLPIVVFTGEAEFKCDLGSQVLKLGQLTAYLNQARPTVFDERKMTYIVGCIEMKRSQRSTEQDEYHVNYVRKRIRK